MSADVVVIGSGPGGYECAFHAAELGLKVILISKDSSLGGVCLNEGCIPSKAWLHIAMLLNELKSYKNIGLISYENIKVNTDIAVEWINKNVIGKLSLGLDSLMKSKKLQKITGIAKIIDKNTVLVNDVRVYAKNIVIATGSSPVWLPNLPVDSRFLTSASALQVDKVSGRLLIVGAGVIGCEMACVFSSLGVDVTVCDIRDRILTSFDEQLSIMLKNALEEQGIRFILNAEYVSCVAESEITVHLKQQNKNLHLSFDQVLIAVGRKPNSDNLGLEELAVMLADNKAIIVDDCLRTNIDNIYALGDVAGGTLAHEAATQGKLCAEILAGKPLRYDVKAMPYVVYTYPELAWVGKTENELQKSGISYQVKTCNWRVNGRAVATLHQHGLTKILVNNEGLILGAGIVGVGAGDLISELALSLEMSCDIEDLRLTVHPHPSISETISSVS